MNRLIIKILLIVLVMLILIQQGAQKRRGIIVFNSANAPLKIVGVRSTDDLFKHQLKIENTVKETVVNFTLNGIMYSSQQRLLGGFAQRFQMFFKSKEIRDVEINLAEIFLWRADKAEEEGIALHRNESMIIALTQVCMVRKDKKGVQCWVLPAERIVHLQLSDVVKSRRIYGEVQPYSDKIQCMLGATNMEEKGTQCKVCQLCIPYAYECNKRGIVRGCKRGACIKFTCICSSEICTYICTANISSKEI